MFPLALNAAARRARGNIILRLDQDTVLTPTFFTWYERQCFGDGVYMLLGRRDSHETDRDALIADPWGYASDESKVLSTPYWNGAYDPGGLASGLGAVGVMIFSRDMWHRVQGYNEKLTGWGHMEIELWKTAMSFAKPTQPIGLSDLYPAIHIYHGRTSHKKHNNLGQMNRTDNPAYGFGQRELHEVVSGCAHETFAH